MKRVSRGVECRLKLESGGDVSRSYPSFGRTNKSLVRNVAEPKQPTGYRRTIIQGQSLTCVYATFARRSRQHRSFLKATAICRKSDR